MMNYPFHKWLNLKEDFGFRIATRFDRHPIVINRSRDGYSSRMSVTIGPVVVVMYYDRIYAPYGLSNITYSIRGSGHIVKYFDSKYSMEQFVLEMLDYHV